MMHSSSPERPIRIPFDSLTLRAVIAELRLRLPGGQIQEIRQPAPTELQLVIRIMFNKDAADLDFKEAAVLAAAINQPSSFDPYSQAGLDAITPRYNYVVSGMGHAWSGGDAAFSWADLKGPDETAIMWQFFRAYRR